MSGILTRDIHPSETPLFVACALRGLSLQDTEDGRLYRLVQASKVPGTPDQVLADNATFKDVANFLGATGRTTLRQALERDGYAWPDSPEAFLATIRLL